jgi:hypothetical protein
MYLSDGVHGGAAQRDGRELLAHERLHALWQQRVGEVAVAQAPVLRATHMNRTVIELQKAMYHTSVPRQAN